MTASTARAAEQEVELSVGDATTWWTPDQMAEVVHALLRAATS